MKYAHKNLTKQFWNGKKDEIKLEINKTGCEEALRRALKDFTPRTEKRKSGSTEKLGVEEMLKKLNTTNFVDKFVEFFSGEKCKSEDQFDEWHKNMCNDFLKVFKSYYESLAYGKAQKIVNMTFKGIYCLNGAEEKEEYFRYCHMPLDSLTLEWFKRKVKGNVKINGEKITNNKVVPWSKLNYNSKSEDREYTYIEIQNAIRKFIDTKPGWTSLKAEFLIWPQIQLELATEGLYSNLLKCSDLLKIEEDKLYNNCSIDLTKREEIINKKLEYKIKYFNEAFRERTTKEKIDFLKEVVGDIDYVFISGELSGGPSKNR